MSTKLYSVMAYSRFNVFETRTLRIIFESKREKETISDENCMCCFIICSHHNIL
jgi:hypothetical protein